MSESFDVAVIGGGVVGASTAFHLAKLGGARVVLLERGEICSGGTAKSCAIIRSHYSVPSNTALTLKSLEIFSDFAAAVEDDEADCGFVNSGYLIVAGPGKFAENLSSNLAMQAGVGAETFAIDDKQALDLHPLLNLSDVVAIGYEPNSGYADPYLTTSGFIAAARKRGVDVRPGSRVTGIATEGGKATGVETTGGVVHADAVVSAVGPWTPDVVDGLGLDLGLEVSRHIVLTFRVAEDYARTTPIVKDLTTENKMYFRPASGGVVLVGTGDHGDPVTGPDAMDENVDDDFVLLQGGQIAHRMPSFAEAELTASWIGPYDITPDWNPVLGPVPDIDGLHMAYGFSGHGFKLSPAVGKCLAQTVLGQAPDVDIAPYRLGRFADGALLTGAYGIGSIS